MNFAKTALILRGITGAGKSTFARQQLDLAKRAGLTAERYCTDDLFVVDGVYTFDGALLRSHHATCLYYFTQACARGVDLLLCDNTNIRHRDYEAYVSAAREHGYQVLVVALPLISVDEALVRSTHQVPRHAVERHIRDWEV